MEKGYIYKIKNLVNNKYYIGQTIQYYEIRWKNHKSNAFNPNSKYYNYPLYQAFRKYGLQNFSFEVIEECNIEDLNQKEMKWISFYESYKNGYNQTLGGDGYKKYDLNELEIIKSYQKFNNIHFVSQVYGCSSKTIQSILLKNNITIVKPIIQKGNKVLQYDKNHNLVHSFPSLIDCGKWLLDNHYSNAKSPENASKIIRNHIMSQKPFANYFWESEEYSQEYKKFYLKQKKENYKNTNPFLRKNNCPNCGQLKYKDSKICVNCENNRRKLEHIKNIENQYGFTKESFTKEIYENSFLFLGKKYNVSDNTIRKWCKLYNLPYLKKDIKRHEKN